MRTTADRIRIVAQARRWVRVLSFQASGYYAQGIAAPAVVDELLDVWLTSGGSKCPS